MGAVTARDVLALLERRGAQLAAGESGLDRPVTWASAMRPRSPAFEGLQGDELALVALSTLRALQAQDDSLSLARLIEDLADRGVAAIAVAGLHLPPASEPAGQRQAAPAEGAIPLGARPLPPGVRRTPGPLVENEQRALTAEELRLATTLALPLLALPPGTPLAEVERDVIAFIVARRSAGAEMDPDRPRDVYDALMRASLRGEDDRALGQRLATMLSATVALADADDLRWCALPDRFPLSQDALVALLRRPSTRAALRLGTGHEPSLPTAGPYPHARTVRLHPLAPGLHLLLAPLEGGTRERSEEPGPARRSGPTPEAGTQVAGYLCLIVPDEVGESGAAARPRSRESATIREDALQTQAAALEHVAPLFALALARGSTLARAGHELRVETLDVLLAGTYPSESQMRARAAQLGHDLDHPHAVLVVELPSAHLGGAEAGSHTLPQGRAGREAKISAGLESALERAWVRAREGEVVALLPLPDNATERFTEPATAELAARAAVLLEGAAGAGEWSAGLGPVAVGPAAIGPAYVEARDTARLGLSLLGPKRLARPVDLGIYRLLLRLRGTGELEDFCRRTLGPLLADTRLAETHLETLDAFFACNGNLSEAARQLHLHRNSLIYRLGRLRELLGHDLDDPEARLTLQLALKARRVLAL